MARQWLTTRWVTSFVSVGVGILALSTLPASAALDGDAYGLAMTVVPTSPFHVAGSSTTYAATGACLSPDGTPMYVDLSGSESGGCSMTAASGSSLGLTGCGTGSMTAASWLLTEPSGDVASFNGSGVVVGGVAVIVGSPLHASGDGYRDPQSSLSPGSGVTVGVLIPKPAETCVGGIDTFKFIGSLVGEY